MLKEINLKDSGIKFLAIGSRRAWVDEDSGWKIVERTSDYAGYDQKGRCIFGGRKTLDNAENDIKELKGKSEFIETSYEGKPIILDVGYHYSIEDIEPGVRDMVFALNAEGFKTIASCEGHNGGRAWINFDNYVIDMLNDESNREIIRSIIEERGGRNIRFDGRSVEFDL